MFMLKWTAHSVIKTLDMYYQKVEKTDLQVLLHTHYSHPQIHGHFRIHLLRAEGLFYSGSCHSIFFSIYFFQAVHL